MQDPSHVDYEAKGNLGTSNVENAQFKKKRDYCIMQEILKGGGGDYLSRGRGGSCLSFPPK